MESKKGLKPGMKVRNLISGNVGELMSHSTKKPNQLSFCTDWCVYIRTRLLSGKWDYRHWNLKNIKLVKE